MVQLKKMIDHSKITCQIESIDQQLAEKYLERNFKSNRLLKKRTLDSLVLDMKNDDFHLGWDCIAFNEEGELVNGQHRLNAVAKAGKTFNFIVLRNVKHETINHFDQGNKRSQSDRITVSGTRIHRKACCCIVAAMRSYEDPNEGGSLYSRERYDYLIKYHFKKHSDFFEALEADGYCQSKYLNGFVLGAFKIFAEMEVGKSAQQYYSHKMGSYERAIHWLDLSIGSATDGRTIDQNFDQAMWKLKDILINRKSRGFTARGLQTHRAFMCAASYFMKGKNTEIRPTKVSNDPFTPLKELMKTNKPNKSPGFTG